MKLARQYFLEIGQPGRVRTIARRQSYHGTTLGALAAGGNMMRREYYEPILSQAHSLVSPCFAYRFKHDGETDAAYLRTAERRTGSRISTCRSRNGHRVPGRAGGRRDDRLRHRDPRLFPARAGDLRPPRRAADPGRGDVRHGPHRHDARLGAGGHHARHPGHRQGPRRRLSADRRDFDRRSYRSGAGGGLRRVSARPDLSGASGRLRRRAGGATDHPRRRPAGQRPRDGRSAGSGADGTVRQPPPCRRRARPRPVLGSGVRRRPRHRSRCSIRR